MKKLFTKQELLSRKGCYSIERINKLFPTQEDISIKEILSVESVNIKDKRWFIYNSCELTLEERKELGLILAWIVLPIYEEKYPNDLRVRECLDAVVQFNKGEINKEKLLENRRNAADAAAYAAYAADAAYAVAAAAAYVAAAADADAAVADADAAVAAAYVADAAAYVADAAAADAVASAAKTTTYSQRILNALLTFFE